MVLKLNFGTSNFLKILRQKGGRGFSFEKQTSVSPRDTSQAEQNKYLGNSKICGLRVVYSKIPKKPDFE